MVMDVLSISDMAESKLPPDVIAFLSSKLATTAELLSSMSSDHYMCFVRISGWESSVGDETSKEIGFD